MTIDTAKLKAAAQGALQPHERLSALPTNDIFDISLAEGTQLDADITAVNAFHDESTHAKILKLIAALEAADRAQSASELEAAEKRNADLDERLIRYAGIATRRAEHVAELEKRAAELEARAVKLPKRSVGEVMRLSGFSREYAEGWCSGNDNARHEIQLAGINLETGGE